MKESIAILGIDDGSFELFSDAILPVIGVVMKGNNLIDGTMHTIIQVDDIDPTSKLIGMIDNSPHKEQLQVIMHEGITIGGFGIIDITRISDQLEIPVICVSRKKVNIEKFKVALENVNQSGTRLELVKKAGKHYYSNTNDIYFHFAGCDIHTAEEFISSSILIGKQPEAIRLADMIANTASAVLSTYKFIEDTSDTSETSM